MYAGLGLLVVVGVARGLALVVSGVGVVPGLPDDVIEALCLGASVGGALGPVDWVVGALCCPLSATSSLSFIFYITKVYFNILVRTARA